MVPAVGMARTAGLAARWIRSNQPRGFGMLAPQRQAEGSGTMHRVTIGDVTVISVNDMTGAFPGAYVYPGAASLQQDYGRFLDAVGNLPMPFQSFVLLDGDRTILVDTGYGPEENGRLLEEIENAGIDREAIDTIVFTHLHVDHTAWNIDRATGKPNFPNAAYLVPQKDWDFYSNGQHPSFERDVRPLEALGRLELVDGERTLTPSITTVPTPGHTPGHTSLAIVSRGEHGFITGDVLLSEIDVIDPSLVSNFDEDQPLAVTTRRRIVDQLAGQEILVGAGHLPEPGFGRIVREGAGQHWQGIGQER
jgi:glyoxylase-like metal-dependent hydrolase (beta-lactamase superfamily II)